MPKTLNERQAWLYLARKWAKPKLDPDQQAYICLTRGQKYGYLGLCACIYALWQHDYIKETIRSAMEARLTALDKENVSRSSPYFYPLTLAGAAQRAELCRKLAKSCTE